MDYVDIGLDRKVSRFSLGTWSFSGAKIWGPSEEEDSIRTIRLAVDLGINLLDTAQKYGDGVSEAVLGKAVKGIRDKVLLATKVHIASLGYDDVIAECERSLARLGTDYLDIYQIHWASKVIPFEETLGAFEKLKNDGKVRAIGVCNFGVKSIAAAAGHTIVTNQLPYNLIWRQVEDEIVPASVKSGMSIWPYCPLAQGLLTGKFKSVEDVPLGRRETRYYSSEWKQGSHSDPGFEKEIFAFLADLRQLAATSGYAMSALALAFLKTRPGVGSVLIGARNETQLRENLATFEATVPDDLLGEVVRLADVLKPKMGTNPDMWQSADGGRYF